MAAAPPAPPAPPVLPAMPVVPPHLEEWVDGVRRLAVVKELRWYPARGELTDVRGPVRLTPTLTFTP